MLPGFEELACLLANDIPYAPAKRLLGFFCDDETIISDHGIENIAMQRGEDVRQYLKEQESRADCPVDFVPRNPRRGTAWPEDLKESVKDLLQGTDADQVPEGISWYDWKRIRQQYNARYTPLEMIDDAVLNELSELGPKPQPGELLIFVDEILVNNWNEPKYLQHLTGALLTSDGIYYLSGENLVQSIDTLVAKIDPQSITVIADGAKWITKQIYHGVLKDFENKRLILDWYHLQKKCKELLSMVCNGKAHKNEVFSSLMLKLWHGNLVDGLELLHSLRDTCRNEAKLDELIAYLTKRSDSIPNYHERRMNCLYNGSAIVEKANDLLVAHRQKNTSMKWTRRGGDALLAFKTLQFNDQWDRYWSTLADIA